MVFQFLTESLRMKEEYFFDKVSSVNRHPLGEIQAAPMCRKTGALWKRSRGLPRV